MLRVHGVIEAANVGSGEFSGEIGERGPELRKFGERGLANDGDSVIRRKIMEIVLKSDKTERIDLAVGGIAGDDIDLMIEKRAVDEAEIHGSGGSGEMQIVAVGEAGVAVGPLLEFVSDTGTPFGRDGNKVGKAAQVEIIGVVGTDDHGESIFEAERLGEFKLKTLGVKLLDAVVNGGGIGSGRFIEYGGERGAGVLDVEIEIAGEQSFVDQESTAEIGLAIDGDASAGFDVLGEEFSEDDLLGEKF